MNPGSSQTWCRAAGDKPTQHWCSGAAASGSLGLLMSHRCTTSPAKIQAATLAGGQKREHKTNTRNPNGQNPNKGASKRGAHQNYRRASEKTTKTTFPPRYSSTTNFKGGTCSPACSWRCFGPSGHRQPHHCNISNSSRSKCLPLPR